METMILFIKIGIGIAILSFIIYLWNLHCEKVAEKRELEERRKEHQEEQARISAIRDRLRTNPIICDILEKIHSEFDEILAKASVTPILKGNRHYYSINIFSYAVKTGERLGTGLLSVCPNKSKFYFSSYNMDEMPRDYVIALAKEISADFYNRYKDKFPETPLFAKIETSSQNTDGEIDDDEGVFFIKIDLTQLHPKYNAW